MKKTAPWIGLIAAGPLNGPLLRLGKLHPHLGPVCAATSRVASRLANRLKAGNAAELEALGGVTLVLIAGSETAVQELIELAMASGIDWQGRTVLLLNTDRPASDLAGLAAAGAETGTLDEVDGFPKPHYAVDAGERPRKLIQRFARALGSELLLLKPGGKREFLRGVRLAGAGLAHTAGSAAEAMQEAGLSAAEATSLAGHLALDSIRNWMRAGKRGASPDASPGLAARKERLLETGRLAASLAHDWNNLMHLAGSIAAEMEGQLAEDHPARRTAGDLGSVFIQASDVPRRLLAWLREEPGQRVEVDLHTVLREAMPLVTMTAGSGVLCSLEGEANLPAVVLDPGLFVHALLNLARNAREAMGGTGRLTMRTRMGPGSVVVEVEDTGRGIAPEHVTRLFEPFFTTKMGAGGYGLGLEPVRELVHLHGGKIGVETTLGQGTRFVLSFPAVQTQRAAASGAGSISKG